MSTDRSASLRSRKTASSSAAEQTESATDTASSAAASLEKSAASQRSSSQPTQGIVPSHRLSRKTSAIDPASAAPSLGFAVASFLAVRFFSALFNNAGDCDETFNFWEPSHYLLYGFGFQTWEYSPEYSLRSYFYVLLHSAVGWLFWPFFGYNKIIVYFATKTILGCCSALCEVVFYRGVLHRFGGSVAYYTFFFMIFSPGMFIASTSYLPSSFSMYGTMLVFGYWFSGGSLNGLLATIAAAGSGLIGWPFVGVLFVPFGIDSLRKFGVLRVLTWAIVALLIWLVPSVLVDYYYYGKIVFPFMNILLYNVIEAGSHGGSTLYGTEPPFFYFLNGFLNFNLVFLLAMPSILLLLAFKKWSGTLQYLRSNIDLILYFSPMYVWLILMSCQPHKEERFLFVIYPLICLAAAASLVILLNILQALCGAFLQRTASTSFVLKLGAVVAFVVVFSFVALSFSRVISLNVNYSAPVLTYTHLYTSEFKGGKFDDIPRKGDVSVCVGKEWYRFPSNYFMPSERFHLRFLRSAFRGQLPKPFAPLPNGTSVIPKGFNRLNREEMDRYTDLQGCDYLVDMDFEGQAEPHYIKAQTTWEVIYEFPFLNSSKSHWFFRAFWIPYLSNQHCEFNRYFVLKRREKT
mmetsp:Transcript_18208/g.46227  ORF Transcript_18208/g.46227 Transcript_18208/m.46227 type:complete len:632 (-) Transcript_18208:55-1950(-)|eukprot:CAMPEP_0177675678 /NCGR_PEP_ID=MMETSP0447-20121125/27337_1 /TAXON_ID=0 /ORGANISM="Stygamoeba regulata, Strain BSH-02190019" /LENGTH=631 /DNA_ID=CAMNT_0019184097 /DNA_START=201 /DNA_END=2096 /DNA_ORIENTATION=+